MHIVNFRKKMLVSRKITIAQIYCCGDRGFIYRRCRLESQALPEGRVTQRGSESDKVQDAQRHDAQPS
jgi:hypothetical protein